MHTVRIFSLLSQIKIMCQSSIYDEIYINQLVHLHLFFIIWFLSCYWFPFQQTTDCFLTPLIWIRTLENLEPHSAPLEIGHPEVGRYFSEFADTHYAANEELQARYPEDTEETLRAVQELYHKLSQGSAAQDQAPATDPSSKQALPM